MLDATRTIIQAAVNADRTMPDGERRAVLAVCRKGYDWRKPQGGADFRTLTAPEAAERLGVSLPTINRMKKRGLLRTVKVCGVPRITIQSISAIVAG